MQQTATTKRRHDNDKEYDGHELSKLVDSIEEVVSKQLTYKEKVAITEDVHGVPVEDSWQ